MGKIILTNDSISRMEQELECLKRADKLVDEVIPDRLEQLKMHNLLRGSIALLQSIVVDFEKGKEA